MTSTHMHILTGARAHTRIYTHRRVHTPLAPGLSSTNYLRSGHQGHEQEGQPLPQRTPERPLCSQLSPWALGDSDPRVGQV